MGEPSAVRATVENPTGWLDTRLLPTELREMEAVRLLADLRNARRLFLDVDRPQPQQVAFPLEGFAEALDRPYDSRLSRYIGEIIAHVTFDMRSLCAAPMQRCPHCWGEVRWGLHIDLA